VSLATWTCGTSSNYLPSQCDWDEIKKNNEEISETGVILWN